MGKGVTILNGKHSFIKMFRYRTRENKTPLENYCTEAFVFVLNYLLLADKRSVKEVLSLFGFENTENIEHLHIMTQQVYYVNSQKVIPDIVIERNGEATIIEVKVNSELNYYDLDKKTIDQLTLYRKINDVKVKNVYLLCKKLIKADNRVLWSSVYEKLSSMNDFIVQSFLCFLEDNGMKAAKLSKDVLKLVDTVNNFRNLMEDSWGYDKNYKLSFGFATKNSWIGFYVKGKLKNSRKAEKLFWIGLISDYPENIVFQIQSDNLAEKIGKFSNYEIISKLPLENILVKSKYEDQKVIIKEWIQKVIEKNMKDYLIWN
jgi:hypothetical protein